MATIISLIPNALAYNVGYQSLNQPVFTRIPTVCAELPSDFPTSQGQLDLYMQTIQNRVSEWSSRLQEGATNVNEWKIKYIEVDLQKQPSFDFSTCDIIVVLQAVPHGYDPSPHNFLGYEQYIGNGQRKVVVNYEYYKNCGYPPTYSGYACPTGGFLTIPELGNVILHELGHALGLGHYVSDDPNVMNSWDWNPNDAPSIMIPYVTVNPDYQHIQEIDVQQIHQMYNYEGFLAFVSKNGINPFVSLTANASLMSINGDQTPVVSVTAQISPQYYNIGDKIYITITDSEGRQIYDQDFFTSDSFSQNIMPQGLVPSTYTLNAIYDKMKSLDVSFVFSNTVQPPSTSIESSPTNPVSSTVIPQWIKNTARWWSQGAVSDSEFVQGTQYLIRQGIMQVPQTASTSLSQQIPQWVKNTAGWWANGQISDDDFVKGVQYLISNGIITLDASNVQTQSQNSVTTSSPNPQQNEKSLQSVPNTSRYLPSSQSIYGYFKLDKSQYTASGNPTDMVTISGKVNTPKGGNVVFTIVKPDGNTKKIDADVTSLGDFRTLIILDSSYSLGHYAVSGDYQGLDLGSTSFNLQ